MQRCSDINIVLRGSCCSGFRSGCHLHSLTKQTKRGFPAMRMIWSLRYYIVIWYNNIYLYLQVSSCDRTIVDQLVAVSRKPAANVDPKIPADQVIPLKVLAEILATVAVDSRRVDIGLIKV